MLFRLRVKARLAPLACLCLALAAPAASALPDSAAASLERVALQLKWYHQFQFAGYYAAVEKGYYRDEGLEVELREGDPAIHFTDEVLSGSAEYGINNTDLLIDRVRGKDVVVLGVVFQHSPLVLLSLAEGGLQAPEQFVGKRVMVSLDAEAEIYSMFASEAISLAGIDFIQHSWSLEDLLEGRTDAMTAYSTNETLRLAALGIPYALTRPITYGIDFYGDCLFTSGEELKRHPKRVAAFLRASLRGWEYAMDNREELADLILDRYSTRKSRTELLAEAAAMDELIIHRFVPLGFMNPGRWRHIGDTYAKLGTIPADYSLDGFLYDPSAPALDPKIAWVSLAILGVASAVFLAYIGALKSFNRRLTFQVQQRTRTLEALNTTLNAEILERMARERQVRDSLAEKEVLLREIHHRVKNNLQIISSLMNLKARGSEDAALNALLKEIQSRIFGMAIVHEQLYESADLARIRMDEYFRSLVGELIHSGHGGPLVGFHIEAEEMELTIDEAIPLGLIVGELVTNSLKHAFTGRARGLIEVRFVREARGRILSVNDDGVGRHTECARHGLGLDLVAALAQQLGGALSYPEGEGCRFELVLPSEPKAEKAASLPCPGDGTA